MSLQIRSIITTTRIDKQNGTEVHEDLAIWPCGFRGNYTAVQNCHTDLPLRAVLKWSGTDCDECVQLTCMLYIHHMQLL